MAIQGLGTPPARSNTLAVAHNDSGWGTLENLTNKVSLIHLPIELIGFSLAFLDPEDLETAIKVCRAFRSLLGGGFYWHQPQTQIPQIELRRVITASSQDSIESCGMNEFVKKRTLYHLLNLHRAISCDPIVELTEEIFFKKNGEAELILENVCHKLNCGSSPSEICSIGKNRHDKTAIAAYLCLVNKNLPEAEKLILQAQEECGASEVSDMPLYPMCFNSRHAFWQKVAAKIVRAKIEQDDFKGALNFTVGIYKREGSGEIRNIHDLYLGIADFDDLNDVIIDLTAHFVAHRMVKEVIKAIAEIDGDWKFEARKVFIQEMCHLQQFEDAFRQLKPYNENGSSIEAELFAVFFREYLIYETFENTKNSLTILKTEILDAAFEQLKDIEYGLLLIKKIRESRQASENFLAASLILAKIAAWHEQTITGLFCIAARLVLLGQIDVAEKLFGTATTRSNATPPDEVDGSIAAWYQAEYFLHCGQVSRAVKALERYQSEGSPTARLSNLKALMGGLDKLPPPLEKMALTIPKKRFPIPDANQWSFYPIITIKDLYS